jgi:hypothetical protein
MVSQSAVRIVSEGAPSEGKTPVRLLLACGCEIDTRLDENRLITALDGARLAIGKYPCPKDHPVTQTTR